MVLLTLAALWAWVGWAFHWQRYAQINWAAQYMAWGWWLQAALLAAAAVAAPAPHPSCPVQYVGAALATVGVLLYALHSQAFGLMPGPTALATLGFLWMLRLRWTARLCVLPVLALAVEMLTLWLLAAPGG